MSNFLLEPGVAIYLALAVALAVWIGIFIFLWRLDRRVRDLRRQLEAPPRAGQFAPRATLESRAAQPRPSAATEE